MAWRLVTLTVSGQAAEARRAIVVGTDESIRQLGAYLSEPGRERIYHIVGIVADDTELSSMYGFPILGRTTDLNHLVQHHDVRELVLTKDHTHCEQAAQAVVRQYESGVRVHFNVLAEAVARALTLHQTCR